MTNKFLIIGAALVFSMAWAGAAVIPESPIDSVNDFAKVISLERSEQLKEILNRVEAQTGVEITLVTVSRLSDLDSGSGSIESSAQTLFNQWGVGHSAVNNGVLILAAVKDRRVRFEFGKDYTEEDTIGLKEIFPEKILPYFSKGDYSEALFASAMYTVQNVTESIGIWKYHKLSFLTGFLFLISLVLSFFHRKHKRRGWATVSFILSGVFLVLFFNELIKTHQQPGFGGGSTEGVGFTQKWNHSSTVSSVTSSPM